MSHSAVDDQILNQQQKLVESVKPLMAGVPPEIQGGALAELLAVWIAGHFPEMRAELLKLHFTAVEKLIPIAEKEIFGPAGYPASRK